MGSFLEVQVEAPFLHRERVFRAVLEEVARLEGVFSRHRESELTRLLGQGGGRPSPEMREVLTLALKLQEATGGAFHPDPRHGRDTPGIWKLFLDLSAAFLALVSLTGLLLG
ncbi:hypothetical protein GCM10007092_11030 [Thermus composti]|nr:hypothetical protein GCM10007092_11030 [Thermus composti]